MTALDTVDSVFIGICCTHYYLLPCAQSIFLDIRTLHVFLYNVVITLMTILNIQIMHVITYVWYVAIMSKIILNHMQVYRIAMVKGHYTHYVMLHLRHIRFYVVEFNTVSRIYTFLLATDNYYRLQSMRKCCRASNHACPA